MQGYLNCKMAQAVQQISWLGTGYATCSVNLEEMVRRKSQVPRYIHVEGRTATGLNDLPSNLPVHSALVGVTIPLWKSRQSYVRPIKRIG